MVMTGGADNNNNNNNTTRQQEQQQQQGPDGDGTGDAGAVTAAAVVPSWLEGILSDDSDDEDYVQGRGTKKTKKNKKKKRRRRRLTMPPTTNKRSRVSVEQKQPQLQLPPIEMLPQEIWKKVMLMLDNNREVYNLAIRCNNKLLHRLIVYDDEIVIRSAIFSGGNAQHKMSNLIDLVGKKRSVCVPSTYRLLRLANATMCERLHDCYGYNLRTGLSCEIYGTFPFGLAICSDCVDVVSTNIAPPNNNSRRRRHGGGGGGGNNNEYSFATNNDRVATTTGDDNCTRLMIGPTTELVTCETTGACFFGKDIKQITKTYDTLEERTTALEELFKNVDERRNDDDDVDNNRVEKLVEICNTAMAEYPAFRQAKFQLIHEKERAKDQKEMTKRMNEMRVVYGKMSTLLAGYEHKDIVLDCTWYDDSRYDCFRFEFLPSMAILGRLITKNPDRSTDRKIKNAVAKVTEAYNLLHENGFLSHNYLESLGVVGHHRAGRAFLRYCRKKYPSYEELLATPNYYFSYEMNTSFLAPLRQGKLFTALCELKRYGNGDFENAFVDNALNMISSQSDETTRTMYMKAAIRIWTRDQNNRPAGDDDNAAAGGGQQQPSNRDEEYSEYKGRFDRCRNELHSLIANFRDYKRQPDTVAFLAETGPPPQNRLHGRAFTRSDAVNKTLLTGRGEDLLRNRDFAGLLGLHRRWFRSPREFFGYSY